MKRITPAGYAFLIWNLIFLTQGLLCLLISFKRYNDYLIKISIFLITNYLLNAFWGTIFIYELFGFSVIVIFGILLTLIANYLILNIGVSVLEVYRTFKGGLKLIDFKSDLVVHMKSKIQTYIVYFFIHFPISIYLGWVTVATILNVSIYFSVPPISWFVFITN